MVSDREWNIIVHPQTQHRIQGKTKSIDQYVTDLRMISTNCKFGALEEEMLRDRIVCGVFSEKMKERLLRDNELTSQKPISVCVAQTRNLKADSKTYNMMSKFMLHDLEDIVFAVCPSV
jgi:hypothetical protein